MSTRAAIIIKQGPMYVGKYIHFDGYLSYTGEILMKYYSSNNTANSLFKDDRYISTLSNNVDKIEYMKDGTMVSMDNYENLVEFFKKMFCEYIYYYDNGTWSLVYAT